MGQGPRYRVPFRRRREGRTDYRDRLALIKSGAPRLVVRKGLRTITVQFVEFHEKGDVVRAAATSRELAQHGWTHSGSATPAAYLTGLLAARRAKGKGVARAVLDIGHHEPTKGSRVFAALKGVLDGGVQVPHSDEVLPDEKRLQGAHLPGAPVADFQKVKSALAGGT